MFRMRKCKKSNWNAKLNDNIRTHVQVVHPVLDQEYGMEEIEVFLKSSYSSICIFVIILIIVFQIENKFIIKIRFGFPVCRAECDNWTYADINTLCQIPNASHPNPISPNTASQMPNTPSQIPGVAFPCAKCDSWTWTRKEPEHGWEALHHP